MTVQMTDKEAAIERQCVEWVFGLTGGELSDKPLTYMRLGELEPRTFLYHFDGVPEWCASDYPDLHDSHVDYFTAVRCCLYDEHHEYIEIDGKRYVKVESYVSSGETECPGKHEDSGDKVTPDHCDGGRVCVLCEAELGEEHGYIYLGDGWCEIVYRHDGIEHMRQLCSSHNVNVWSEPMVEVVHEGCGTYFVPASVGADGGCPSCEAAPAEVTVSTENLTTDPVWWWQTCSPGCLPDSDVMGPFDDETEALENATDGLE